MVNKVSPETALAVEYVTTAVAFVFVLLRLYVRGWLQARFDVADIFVVISLLCFCIDNSIDFVTHKLGFWNADLVVGPDGPPDLRQLFSDHATLKIMLKLLYAEMVSYYSSLFFVKFAFLYLYHQLIPPSMIKLRKALKVTTAGTVAGYLGVVLTSLFYCLPVNRNWELDGSKSCYSGLESVPYFVAVITHIVTDIAIYTIPFFLLPRLRFLERSLAGLIAVFSLGFFAIMISILRIIFNIEVWIPLLCIWSSSEQAAGILVVCTPPLKWLFKGFTLGVLSKRGSLSDSTKGWSGAERSVIVAPNDEEKPEGAVEVSTAEQASS